MHRGAHRVEEGVGVETAEVDVRRPQPARIDLVVDETALALFAHQPGIAQHRQVLGHRRLADRHALAQRAGMLPALGQLFEDVAAGGVGQRFEEGVLDHDKHISNH